MPTATPTKATPPIRGSEYRIGPGDVARTQVRAAPGEVDRWKRAAWLDHRPMNTWMRLVLNAAAAEELAVRGGVNGTPDGPAGPPGLWPTRNGR